MLQTWRRSSMELVTSTHSTLLCTEFRPCPRQQRRSPPRWGRGCPPGRGGQQTSPHISPPHSRSVPSSCPSRTLWRPSSRRTQSPMRAQSYLRKRFALLIQKWKESKIQIQFFNSYPGWGRRDRGCWEEGQTWSWWAGSESGLAGESVCRSIYMGGREWSDTLIVLQSMWIILVRSLPSRGAEKRSTKIINFFFAGRFRPYGIVNFSFRTNKEVSITSEHEEIHI